jgi:hypothetical protein
VSESTEDPSHLSHDARKSIMRAAYAYAEACQQTAMILMRHNGSAASMREARDLENAARAALENVLADLTWPPPYHGAPTAPERP